MTERKDLAKRILPIAVPIMVQCLVLSIINATNTMMMGMIGETVVSAISVGNQLMLIYNAILLGLCVGATALFTQFWGKGDVSNVRCAEAVTLQISMCCAVVAFIVTAFFPQIICGLYTKDPIVMKLATEYLRVTSAAFLAMGFSQVYLTLLKTTGHIKRYTVISVSTGVLGIGISAVLVFGKLEAPCLGLIGAAIGVSASRIIELIITLIDCYRTKVFILTIGILVDRHKVMRLKFIKTALPALATYAGFNIATSVVVGIMGHIGTTALAAFAIANVCYQLFAPIAQGYGTALGILVGNELGRNNIVEARKLGDTGMHLAVYIGIVAAIIMSLSSLFTPWIGSTLSVTGRHYLTILLLILSIKLGGSIINTTLCNGIFVAGGDTMFMCKTDMINMWLFIIPLGLLVTGKLNLPVVVSLIVLNMDEFTKMPFEYHHYKKYIWLKNLTHKEWTSFSNYHNMIDQAIDKNMSTGAVTIDGRGRVRLMNQSSKEILGLTDTEAASKSFADLFIGDIRNDDFVQTVVNAVEGRHPVSNHELKYYSGDTVKHLIVNTTFVEDDDAKAGVLLTMNEINDSI